MSVIPCVTLWFLLFCVYGSVFVMGLGQNRYKCAAKFRTCIGVTQMTKGIVSAFIIVLGDTPASAKAPKG